MLAEEQELERLVRLAINVKGDIELVKKKYLQTLEEEAKAYTSRILVLLQKLGKTEFAIEGKGKVSKSDRTTPSKLDEESVAQALGLQDLADYKVKGKPYSVLLVKAESEKEV